MKNGKESAQKNDMQDLFYRRWGTKVERERHRRIKVALWAYAYEFENRSLVSDGEFDKESRLINPTLSTGHQRLDDFFRNLFHPDTGMWIHQHPELRKVKAVYDKMYSGR